jgi:hypothetical protein
MGRGVPALKHLSAICRQIHAGVSVDQAQQQLTARQLQQHVVNPPVIEPLNSSKISNNVNRASR